MPMIFLVYKEIYFNINELDSCIPSVCVSFFQDYEDILPKNGIPIVDSNTSSFEERGDYTNQRASLKDPLNVPIGPITRFETKRIQEKFIGLILDIGLTSYKSIKIDIYVLFGPCMELQVELCCDPS